MDCPSGTCWSRSPRIRLICLPARPQYALRAICRGRFCASCGLAPAMKRGAPGATSVASGSLQADSHPRMQAARTAPPCTSFSTTDGKSALFRCVGVEAFRELEAACGRRYTAASGGAKQLSSTVYRHVEEPLRSWRSESRRPSPEVCVFSLEKVLNPHAEWSEAPPDARQSPAVAQARPAAVRRSSTRCRSISALNRLKMSAPAATCRGRW